MGHHPSGARRAGRGGIGRRARLRPGAPRHKSSNLFVRTIFPTAVSKPVCGSSSVAERNLAKVEVASPSLAHRSTSEFPALRLPPGKPAVSLCFEFSSSLKSRLFTGGERGIHRPNRTPAGVAQWQSSSLPSWSRVRFPSPAPCAFSSVGRAPDSNQGVPGSSPRGGPCFTSNRWAFCLVTAF